MLIDPVDGDSASTMNRVDSPVQRVAVEPVVHTGTDASLC